MAAAVTRSVVAPSARMSASVHTREFISGFLPVQGLPRQQVWRGRRGQGTVIRSPAWHGYRHVRAWRLPPVRVERGRLAAVDGDCVGAAAADGCGPGMAVWA